MILDLSRMRRNVNRKDYNDRKNVIGTASLNDGAIGRLVLGLPFQVFGSIGMLGQYTTPSCAIGCLAPGLRMFLMQLDI